MNEGFDPEGRRLPIKLDGTSNGEFLPRPPPLVAQLANRLALERAGANARRLGLSRRAFLKSLCGAAATLGAMNDAGAALGRVGGYFSMPREAAFEPSAAAALGGEELIFDVQGHHVNPLGSWRRWTNRWTYILRFFPQSDCGVGAVECFSAEHFIREIFLDSDTDLAVLSMVPAGPGDEPLLPEDAAATRALVQAMEGRDRLLIHALVRPNVEGDVAAMAEQMARYRIDGWKTYTQWGPWWVGYWLDDEDTGIPFIEQARAVGAPIICVHKGISLFGMAERYSGCRDVGVVAKRYPDVNFLIYHSGYQLDHDEGPYDPDRAVGVDSLIQSLLDNGVAPNSNVYAELGTTWRRLMTDSDQAAHLLGKLFKYVGENNVLWGTDSIWYGSPQDQIQAFRSFQISDQFQERYGYPPITPELRAKVFGLNAVRAYRLSAESIRQRLGDDRVARIRADYQRSPDPSFLTNGPRTRREFLALHRAQRGLP